MRVSFHTFGCKLNQSESEALASTYRSQGFFIVPEAKDADLTIVNTCAVTSKSTQKARRLIRKLSRENPDSFIIITGCYAQVGQKELEDLVPNSIVFPLDRTASLLDLPAKLSDLSGDRNWEQKISILNERDGPGEDLLKNGAERFRFKADSQTFRSRAFLKIQDGCDNSCSYCIVPLARGSSVSAPLESLVNQAAALERKGYREIVLTGVNISSYQNDGNGLSALLNAILDETSKIRVRLSSLEPDAITSSLYRVLESERICPHFHLPVQSGSDKVLKKMNRHYGSALVREVAANLKRIKGDPFLAGDFIVGFPGETEEDFNESLSVASDIGFAHLHVFQFSPRPGTMAPEMAGKIPERIVKERSRQMGLLSGRLYRQYIKLWKGRVVEVVMETTSSAEADRKIAFGLTENYLKVLFAAPPPVHLRPGGLCKGVITDINGDQCVFKVLQ